MALRLILAVLLLASHTSTLALDFAAMEAMVIDAQKALAEQPSSAIATCIPQHTDKETESHPSDFDYCKPGLQAQLADKGLYLSVDGTTKPLLVKNSNNASISQVEVPTPVRDDVASEPVSPFVLNLE